MLCHGSVLPGNIDIRILVGLRSVSKLEANHAIDSRELQMECSIIYCKLNLVTLNGLGCQDVILAREAVQPSVNYSLSIASLSEGNPQRSIC